MAVKTRMVVLVACFLALGWGDLSAVGATETPLAEGFSDGSAPGIPGSENLQLRSVDLYTGGVGFFHFEGSFNAEGLIALRLPAEHVPDVLKSVVIRSADGSAVPVLSYETSDQLERRLQGAYLDLSGSPNRGTILRRLRGEEVTLVGLATASGRIVALEERRVDETRSELYLTLFGDEGLTERPLSRVEQIIFASEALNREFEGLLEILRESRVAEERVLRLQMDGDYEGPVSVSYIHGVPVWKISYRLVLGEQGEYRLQAWGHVDNTTAVPWRGVDLTLVSSRPVSFQMDLLTPLYAQRPTVAPPQATALAPRRFERSIAEAEEAPMVADRAFSGALRSAPAPAPEPAATGAAASTVPTAVRYAITTEVDLDAGLGAMLPILDTLLPGRRVSLYRSDDGSTPRAGVEITNETGLSLLAGPITVLDQGSFVGDALTTDLAPGEKSILTYALDTDTTVATESQSAPETISSVRIADGLLVSSRIRTVRTVYRFTHHGDSLGTLIIEHPKRPGWEVVGGLRPVSESASYLRFEAPLAGVADRLEVVEEQPVSSSIALERLSTDQIAFYLSRRVIDRETAETLRRLQEVSSQLAEVGREIDGLNREIDVVFRDQERIRRNLEAVPEGSDLAGRYLTTLENQEDELEQLRRERSSVEARRRELESQLAALVAETESE